MFGKKEELDPVYWMLGAAHGWRGLPATAATYVTVVPEKNDPKTPYTLTAKDVPVDTFWPVTLYDDKGWMPLNRVCLTASCVNDGIPCPKRRRHRARKIVWRSSVCACCRGKAEPDF
jgi:hypothetical protein